MNTVPNKHSGFSLIEIIISIAILAIIFSFVFYFVSSISYKDITKDEKPYLFDDFNYSNKYCYLSEGQIDLLSIIKNVDMGSYISSSTIISSIDTLDRDKIIITTNSASTTESDIFMFGFEGLLYQLDIGPGITDALLHDRFLYVLNTSVNSHVKSFEVGASNLNFLNEIKITELAASHAMPKRIYLSDKNILIGTEKNNGGGELFFLPLDDKNFLRYTTLSLEIGGQVSGMHAEQNILYIANASDIELFAYDDHFTMISSYDAPLSLGNGKSVYYLHPYIFLGRTVASFELFFLEMKDLAIRFIDKHKIGGSIDFIQGFGDYILIIGNTQDKELQFFSKDRELIKSVDLPGRVTSYTCLENQLIVSAIINNQSHILWLK